MAGHGEEADEKAVKISVDNPHDINDDEEGEKETKKEFVESKGLTTAEAEELIKIHGKNELQEKSQSKIIIYLKQFIAPMPIMIWMAIIVEAGIQNWIDFGILMGIQFANATIGWYETVKAADAVAALKASLKPKATCKRDGVWADMDARLLVPGDLVLIASGSAVPADCIVNRGQVDIDQAALTGESLPVTMYRGDCPKMGSTCVRGETEGTVESTGMNTFFGKTASMLQTVDGLGNLQKMLMRVMFVLVFMSVVLCGTALIYLLVQGYGAEKSVGFAVVLLVASIPVAIEIVCTTTLALGSRQLSSHGAIVTRLTSIEELAGMNMLCSDKTGTLTLNKMVLQEDCPCYVEGQTFNTVLQHAALAAKWKEPPRDALDTMVLGTADLAALDVYKQLDYVPFDPTTKRTEGTLQGPDGKVFKVSKGAPHIILKLVHNKDKIGPLVDAKVAELGSRGIRALAVARATDEALSTWEMLGILTFLDPPRPDTKDTLMRAMGYGVDVKMITGDHCVIAKETARQLGLGTNIRPASGLPSMAADGKIPKDLGEKYGKFILDADGFAEVFPEHKYLIVEALRQAGFATGMTGDGVNDAPALKRADVGIAVSGSTDAARAAADIVLTEPGLSVVVEAIVIARCIFQRIKSFLTYRIAATLQLLVFFFVAVLSLQPSDYQTIPDPVPEDFEYWPRFFQMPVILLMLITLLNDGTLISIGYDRVHPSERPEKWNLKALFFISSVLGGVAFGSSMLLLWGALDSCSDGSMFSAFGLPCIEYGQVITMIYLKVSLSDFLTLFSARTHEKFFFGSMPSWLLLGAGCVALTISTVLACIWPKGTLDDIPIEGLARGSYQLWAIWVWLYCIVWWFVQDAFKVFFYWFLFKFDIFHFRTAALVNARGAFTFAKEEGAAGKNDPVAASAGAVENKLLTMQVNEVTKKVEELARESGKAAHLARVSNRVDLVRKSVQMQKGRVPDPTEVQDTMEMLKDAVQTADPQVAMQLTHQIEEVQQTANNLIRVSQTVKAHQSEIQHAPMAGVTNLVRTSLQRVSGRAPGAAHDGTSMQALRPTSAHDSSRPAV